MIRCLSALIFAAIVASPAPALQDVDEGFEKELKPRWEQLQGESYPPYNKIEIVRDSARAHGGQSYLRMAIEKGPTALQQSLRHCAEVFPGRAYHLTVFLRLAGTKSNTASIEIRWLDKGGKVVQTDRTFPVSAAPDWTPVSLEVPSIAPTAVWAQIRLVFDGTDVRGEAHFDDLLLVSRPKVLIETVGRSIPVYTAREVATFRVSSPSLTGGPFTLRLRLQDLDGRPRAEEYSTAFEPAKPVSYSVTVPAFGYFELHAEVLDGKTAVASKMVPVLAPPPFIFGKSAGRTFGATLNPYRLKFQSPGALGSLLGLQIAKIVLWDRATGPRSSEPDNAELTDLLRDLVESEGVVFTGVLARPPHSIFPTADRATLEGGAGALFALERPQWELPLRKTLERYRERVAVWQIGGDGDDKTARLIGLDDALAAVESVMKDMKRVTAIGVPIAAEDYAKKSLRKPQFYAINTNAWTDPVAFGRPVGGPESHLTMTLAPLKTGDRAAAQREQIADFLKKAINASKAGARSIYLPLSDMVDVDGFPTAPALAFRAVNDILSNAKFQKGLSLFPHPIQNFVFEKSGQTIVALWSESGVQEKEIFLGYNVKVVDPLGGVAALNPGDRVRVGPIPIFLIGVDSFLLRTQLGLQFYNAPLRLDTPDPTVALRRDPTRKVLRLENFYPEPIQKVRLEILRETLPPDWAIAPLDVSVAKLDPGKALEHPIIVHLPQTEQDGAKELGIVLTYERDGKPYKIKTVRTLVAVSEIDVRIEVTDEPSGAKRVKITIVNHANRTLNLHGLLRVPGRTEQTLDIGGLKDGTAYNRPIEFLLQPPFTGQRIDVQLAETEGKRTFVNKIKKLDE